MSWSRKERREKEKQRGVDKGKGWGQNGRRRVGKDGMEGKKRGRQE